MISRVDFIGVPSRDSERSRKFYVEMLGLRPDEHGEFEFWAGDTCFGIWEHMALFSDPDGNDLMLHHRYAPQGG